MAGPFEQYFAEYAQAFDDFDAERVAGFYFAPCLMVNPEFTGSLTTPHAVEENMRALLGHYKAQGYARCSATDIRVTYQADNLAIVRVRWQIFNAEGACQVDFETTYNLTDHGAGWKILVATTHASEAG